MSVWINSGGAITVKLTHEPHACASSARICSVVYCPRRALVGQLRQLRRRYIDFLIVRFRYAVENKVTGSSVHERRSQ